MSRPGSDGGVRRCRLPLASSGHRERKVNLWLPLIVVVLASSRALFDVRYRAAWLAFAVFWAVCTGWVWWVVRTRGAKTPGWLVIDDEQIARLRPPTRSDPRGRTSLARWDAPFGVSVLANTARSRALLAFTTPTATRFLGLELETVRDADLARHLLDRAVTVPDADLELARRPRPRCAAFGERGARVPRGARSARTGVAAAALPLRRARWGHRGGAGHARDRRRDVRPGRAGRVARVHLPGGGPGGPCALPGDVDPSQGRSRWCSCAARPRSSRVVERGATVGRATATRDARRDRPAVHDAVARRARAGTATVPRPEARHRHAIAAAPRRPERARLGSSGRRPSRCRHGPAPGPRRRPGIQPACPTTATATASTIERRQDRPRRAMRGAACLRRARLRLRGPHRRPRWGRTLTRTRRARAPGRVRRRRGAALAREVRAAPWG